MNVLRNQTQRVDINGISTKFVNVNEGVPQGTVLGSVLFSIMMNDKTAI